MRRESGLTLIEVAIAVTVAALLVGGVVSVTRSTVEATRRHSEESAAELERLRALEILSDDWRGRVGVVTQDESGRPERDLVLKTLGDSIGGGRAVRRVRYIAGEQGLLRAEKGHGNPSALRVVPGPVVFEYWDGESWRKEPPARLQALRVTIGMGQEAIFIR